MPTFRRADGPLHFVRDSSKDGTGTVTEFNPKDLEDAYFAGLDYRGRVYWRKFHLIELDKGGNKNISGLPNYKSAELVYSIGQQLDQERYTLDYRGAGFQARGTYNNKKFIRVFPRSTLSNGIRAGVIPSIQANIRVYFEGFITNFSDKNRKVSVGYSNGSLSGAWANFSFATIGGAITVEPDLKNWTDGNIVEKSASWVNGDTMKIKFTGYASRGLAGSHITVGFGQLTNVDDFWNYSFDFLTGRVSLTRIP